jgi:hypothetical protein
MLRLVAEAAHQTGRQTPAGRGPRHLREFVAGRAEGLRCALLLRGRLLRELHLGLVEESTRRFLGVAGHLARLVARDARHVHRGGVHLGDGLDRAFTRAAGTLAAGGGSHLLRCHVVLLCSCRRRVSIGEARSGARRPATVAAHRRPTEGVLSGGTGQYHPLPAADTEHSLRAAPRHPSSRLTV